MTSPIGGKPESTQDRYNDVYSKGSSFGQDLDEAKVRDILSVQVKNPFLDAVSGVGEFVGGLINEIADAIGDVIPDGASTTPIRDAIVAQMGPVRTQVNTLGQNLQTLSTEVNERIDTQKGLIDDANTAIGEAKSLADAVKKLADENKAKVDSAISKADKANDDLALLSPKVTDAVDKASKASSDVTTLTTRVSTAEGKVATAEQNVAALTPKVTAAQEQAEQSVQGLESLTSDFEVTQAIADKALADLKNLSIGGRNLLQRTTMVQTNTYQEVVDTGEKFWTGEPIYKGTKISTGTPPTQISSSITFEPGDEYTASIWVKSENLAGARVSTNFLFYNGKAYATASPKIDAVEGVWYRLHASWKNDTPDPLLIRFYFYLNRNPGEITYFTSPQIERGNVVTDWTPPIEDFTSEFTDIREDLNQKYSEALSEAQKATNALPGINDQLTEIGAKADQGIADAKAVNDKLPSITQKVTDLTTGQGNLAEGLSKAATQEDYNTLNTTFQQEQVKINTLNTSFQEEQAKLNTLSTDFQTYQSDLNEKQQEWNLGAQRSLTALEDIAAVQKEVNDNNAAFQDFQLGVNEDRVKWEQGATLAINNLTDFSTKQAKWNKASTDATKALSDAAKAQADVNAEQTKFNNFQTDFNAKQTKWNAAVDRSLATQKTVNENFNKWTEGATTAIEANTNAIKALNAPQSGSSIVPMVPGTDTPTWIEPLKSLDRGAQTADSQLPESISQYYRYSGGSIPAGASQSVYIPYRNGVTVDPNLEYEASWYTRVTSGKARYVYISMESPETGRYIIEKAKDGEASSNTWGNPVRPLITPATTTWTKHTSRFKFAPGTRTVYITDIQFSNSGNSSDAYFYIADLQIAPKVPNQFDVDEAQNKAIQANTEFAKQQTAINELFQEQMWTQLDMIEQLDIQQPKVVHVSVKDGKYVTTPSWVGWSKAYLVETPFMDIYTLSSRARKVYWQAKGRWEGSIKHTANFTNGAVDVYVEEMTSDGDRTNLTRGGAAFVSDYRNSTFEIYVRMLGRLVTVKTSLKAGGGVNWTISDTATRDGVPTMIRHQSDDKLRLTTSTFSSQTVTTRTYRDGEWKKKVYSPGQVIPPSIIWKSDLHPSSTTYFEEVNFGTNTV